MSDRWTLDDATTLLGLLVLRCMTGKAVPETWDQLWQQTYGVELAINVFFGPGTPGRKESLQLLAEYRSRLDRWANDQCSDE